MRSTRRRPNNALVSHSGNSRLDTQVDADNIRIPAIVSPLLDWWLGEIRQSLGDTFIAVVLYGSITLDDFCTGWSDVDVCVVVNPPVSETAGVALGKIHDRMRDRFVHERISGWMSGQVVEGSYIPRELVGDEQKRMPCYTAGGSSRRWALGHPVSAFDRYMLAHFGRTIAGAPTRFTPPRKQSLIAQSKRDLADLRRRASSQQSDIWLCGTLHWLARCLIFWRDGKLLSKSSALQHELEKGSPYSDAFRLASQIRREGSAAAAQHHQALRQHFDTCALPCAEEIDAAISTTT